MFAYQKQAKREQKRLGREKKPKGVLRRAWERMRDLVKVPDNIPKVDLASRGLINEVSSSQPVSGKK